MQIFSVEWAQDQDKELSVIFLSSRTDEDSSKNMEKKGKINFDKNFRLVFFLCKRFSSEDQKLF